MDRNEKQTSGVGRDLAKPIKYIDGLDNVDDLLNRSPVANHSGK